MKLRRILILSFFLGLVLTFSFGCSTDSKEEKDSAAPEGSANKKVFLAFGGGPTGGTFNFFANKMANIISVNYEWLNISPKGSGGSAENLRSLNKNGIDIGIVYSGDAFLGRNGKLSNYNTRYDNVRAISFLYGAPAQLVVHKDSGIKSALELEGKIVATGNPGSGAALSAERFFKHIGLWDKMEHRNLGYSQAANDFINKKIDAFWVLVGDPNASVVKAATSTPVSILNINEDAMKSNLYARYPFYSKAIIPKGTYKGQYDEVVTFQDSALWCVSKDMDSKIVYDCLKVIYSDKGLKEMVSAHKAAKDMSIKNGIKNISIPLHPGAVKFWQEQGLEIPAGLLP